MKGFEMLMNGWDRIYRARIIDALNKDLLEELAWLNKSALKHLKNYQIWYLHLPFPLCFAL